MFSDLKLGFQVFIDPLVKHFIHRGYNPDTFTVLGFVFNATAAVFYAFGFFFEGALIMLFGSTTDLIDGQIARQTGGTTDGGALLDSVLDRYSEAVVLMGLAFHYANIGWKVTGLLSIAALTGSILVSYVRARAEGLNYECKVGLMQRPERVIFLAAATIFGVFLGTPNQHVAAAIWIMAILTNLTTGERVLHVRRAARRRAFQTPPGD
jgi:CDP-diacylglycerol--glycerol-3-phosphate 3-phosphatidyltransferase